MDRRLGARLRVVVDWPHHSRALACGDAGGSSLRITIRSISTLGSTAAPSTTTTSGRRAGWWRSTRPGQPLSAVRSHDTSEQRSTLPGTPADAAVPRRDSRRRTQGRGRPARRPCRGPPGGGAAGRAASRSSSWPGPVGCRQPCSRAREPAGDGQASEPRARQHHYFPTSISNRQWSLGPHSSTPFRARVSMASWNPREAKT